MGLCDLSAAQAEFLDRLNAFLPESEPPIELEALKAFFRRQARSLIRLEDAP